MGPNPSAKWRPSTYIGGVLARCDRQYEVGFGSTVRTPRPPSRLAVYIAPMGPGSAGDYADHVRPNSLRPITFPVRSTYNQVTDRVRLERWIDGAAFRPRNSVTLL